jgi:cation diffusion facilitator CzcD-associated flavoprotein CzcO
MVEISFNQFFYALLNDSPQQSAVHDIFSKMMIDRLNGRSDLIEKLVPKWKVGCRRLTPGDGYLEAIQMPNSTCDFDPIIRITEKGIETQKGVEEFDIIIAATGFDVSFKPSFELIGANGKLLDKEWADDPQAYFGTCAPGMPNFFIFNGPNCPVGHGSLLAVMEWTAQYILRWAKKIASEDIRYVSPIMTKILR